MSNNQPHNNPKVAIVGAGPGDVDLMTVKSVRLLQEADVVVYDRLVSDEIMKLVPEKTETTFAGKAARDHHMAQEDINQLLVDLAKQGKKVVRLKGGDPFIFGRGSEEAEFLAKNGIDFEIVPGITASAGCGAYGGIPLTHRGLATGVRFVTGHCRDGEHLDLNWKSLADVDTTLVIYMGLINVSKIVDELIKAGLPSDTPAAGIERGTTPEQRTILTKLSELPECVERAQLKAPSLLIIGRVVDLAHSISWHIPARDCLLERDELENKTKGLPQNK
ncbi:MAG: uroporphyrinogen-III C-methyltransferase [Rhodospirillaceae bacterium]|nr:uroporphyrinogen-III C-methyltransferase [Rhodospirillaceae bacterium]